MQAARGQTIGDGSARAWPCLPRFRTDFMVGADRIPCHGFQQHTLHAQANVLASAPREFAGTTFYGSWWPDLPEAYWGVYVGRRNLFACSNTFDPTIDLTLPETLPVHLNRLPAPIAGENQKLTL